MLERIEIKYDIVVVDVKQEIGCDIVAVKVKREIKHYKIAA